MRRVLASLVASGVLVLGALPALAIVEQIDGRVMPLQVANCPTSGNPTGCVQVALNIGEGLAANAINNPLQAVFDAQTTPEVFAIPRTAGVYGSVVVRDMVEGAGFENSFGWYNLDDPDSLYVMTPCADEPGSQRTVDFEAEFQAGRYLGGFIAFFLITPEDQPVANNCGSIGNEGHQYFTESARNGDGNYVHYLIYTSKVDDRRFYFGFEDLFRGGDNDFEDMFLQVDGLVLPCVPSSEVCDGADNNCDGLIDNDPVDAGGPCGLTDIGECELGVLACVSGALACIGEVPPAAEQCNGLDDNCNDLIDDAPAGEGDECGDDTGECEFGSQTCVGGVFVCVGGVGPSAEVCDTLDNDCNGFPDDDTIDAGGPCGSNVGECEPGTIVCTDGTLGCSGGNPGVDELCDGLDNDCNGAVDDGNPGGGEQCGTDVGICEFGTLFCVGGEVACVGGVPPSEEVCDGVDNDCDGDGDALAVCPEGSQCIEGACTSPCGSGEFPCPGGQVCVGGFCITRGCDEITCDDGELCENGVCIPEGTGQTGTGATGVTGTGVGGGDAQGSTGAGTTGSSGDGDGDGDGGGEATDNFGLATGSGVRCAASPGRATGGGAAGALALAAAVALQRRRRAPKAREEVRS